ncbi:MAG TPA: type II toxin-antitoxin system RelE/ParE family toxin [Verrucomicrobiae bacterium]
MKWQVSLRSRALDDIASAREWYDERVPGLGDDFAAEVLHGFYYLSEFGDIRPRYYGEFRQLLVKRFPYKIFFLFDGEAVVVFRVLHAKQDHSRHLLE